MGRGVDSELGAGCWEMGLGAGEQETDRNRGQETDRNKGCREKNGAREA